MKNEWCEKCDSPIVCCTCIPYLVKQAQFGRVFTNQNLNPMKTSKKKIVCLECGKLIVVCKCDKYPIKIKK